MPDGLTTEGEEATSASPAVDLRSLFPFFAVPAYGGQNDVAFTDAWSALQAELVARGISYAHNFACHDADIHRGRARLAHEALRVGASHLFFIDADIGFAPEQVFRMLSSGHDVCGIPYRRKQSAGFNVLYTPEQLRTGHVDVDDEGYSVVRALATGFLCIKTDVITRLAYAHPELLVRSDHQLTRGEPYFALFNDYITRAPELKGLSEDYAFCERWTDHGGKVHAWVKGSLLHCGRGVWKGALVTDPHVGGKEE